VACPLIKISAENGFSSPEENFSAARYRRSPTLLAKRISATQGKMAITKLRYFPGVDMTRHAQQVTTSARTTECNTFLRLITFAKAHEIKTFASWLSILTESMMRAAAGLKENGL
jgi:hypothetical protein